MPQPSGSKENMIIEDSASNTSTISIKNRQNSEKERHPDSNDGEWNERSCLKSKSLYSGCLDQAPRANPTVYEYGDAKRPPRPDSIRFTCDKGGQ
ncbi:uncharacterized protein N7483_010025 [Penicillium malachiteum]|uniref:uncharacterized protein n=1 Tax=Penicillium malachiteum TaxID=1324776 RepID=UPI002547ECC4|nr:uncharacterized protein N7483_010025 [Penicillium malachiteum]KAJ5712844.1 hypothetical protein N7483_010025 [Penicillium malachiteum]